MAAASSGEGPRRPFVERGDVRPLGRAELESGNGDQLLPLRQ